MIVPGVHGHSMARGRPLSMLGDLCVGCPGRAADVTNVVGAVVELAKITDETDHDFLAGKTSRALVSSDQNDQDPDDGGHRLSGEQASCALA